MKCTHYHFQLHMINYITVLCWKQAPYNQIMLWIKGIFLIYNTNQPFFLFIQYLSLDGVLATKMKTSIFYIASCICKNGKRSTIKKKFILQNYYINNISFSSMTAQTQLHITKIYVQYELVQEIVHVIESVYKVTPESIVLMY